MSPTRPNKLKTIINTTTMSRPIIGNTILLIRHLIQRNKPITTLNKNHQPDQVQLQRQLKIPIRLCSLWMDAMIQVWMILMISSTMPCSPVVIPVAPLVHTLQALLDRANTHLALSWTDKQSRTLPLFIIKLEIVHDLLLFIPFLLHHTLSMYHRNCTI